MKKKLIILLLIVALLPMKVFAKSFVDSYKTMNFTDTLVEEGMEIENKDYKEDDKQAIIYMFRGKGCKYCRAFLTFLNSISVEYGKYFKLVSFEVWNDASNSSLMKKVPLVTNETVTGVPYIVIGDKVFAGYSNKYDEKIKEAIKAQYNNNSYDVMIELDKRLNGSSNSSNTFEIVFFNAFIIIAATVALIIVNNKNNQRILDVLNKNNVKTEVKQEIKKETKKKSK